MSALDRSAPGDVLAGRYLLGECVGQGGMARVFRAQDRVLARTVAVKIMRSDADGASAARLRTEMTLLAGLNHPSLVQVYDGHVEPDGLSYLVMEFVTGTTLAELLRGEPLEPAQTAHVARELASALHAVHDAGIVHRDVKPSNVLVTANPMPGRAPLVKLADFGIAALVDSTRVTAPGTVMGTAAYLAPEQVRGEPATPRADIYALGLVLLEALTGERAFPHASGIGAVMARLFDAPLVPEWVGPEWAGLLTRMTADDPAHRPSALEVVQAADALPTRIPDRPQGEEPAATQPVLVPPAPTHPMQPAVMADPTRPYAPAALAAEEATRAPRWRRASVFTAAAAFATILGLSVGMWALGDAGTPAPLTDVGVVEEQPAPSEPSDAEVGPDPVEQQEPAPQVEQVVAPERGSDAVQQNDAEKAQRDAEKAQRDAEKAQEKADEKAQRDAEKAARDAEKAARDAEKAQREADKGPGGAKGPGEGKASRG